jgi:predicted ATPase
MCSVGTNTAASKPRIRAETTGAESVAAQDAHTQQHGDDQALPRSARTRLRRDTFRHNWQAGSRWRLLETIRAYALEKLVESGEAEWVARRHAQFFRDLYASIASDRWRNRALRRKQPVHPICGRWP